MLSFLLILLAELVLLGAIVLRREPKLLLPAVVLFLPIEILEVVAFDSAGEGSGGGALAIIRGFMNPGQNLMMVTVLVGVYRFRHEPARLFPNSSMIVPMVAVAALMMLGVAWSDSLIPINGILILPLYVAFMFVAPCFIEDRHDVERVTGALIVAAGLMAFIAIVQRGTGFFAWRETLLAADGVSYRSNATFGDPNILARLLAITMALAGGLILVTGPRRQTVYLAAPLLAGGLLAIVATASRSGWLLLLLMALIVVLAAPIQRYTKARIVTLSAVSLVSLLAFLLAQGGPEAQRVQTLNSSRTILGAREYLIGAGWEMFKDSPWLGQGPGAFQHALTVSYLHEIPTWALVTLSHTTVVTVLAELGFLGAALFTFAVIRIGFLVFNVYFRSQDRFHRLMVAWVGAAMLGVLLHSQAEGRLLDEPFLWVFVALFIAIETQGGLLERGPATSPPAGAAAP